MIGGLFRVLFGFIVACLVAGAATVAFVITPADIATLPAELRPDRLSSAGTAVAARGHAFGHLRGALRAHRPRHRRVALHPLVGLLRHRRHPDRVRRLRRRIPERGRRPALDRQQLRHARLPRRGFPGRHCLLASCGQADGAEDAGMSGRRAAGASLPTRRVGRPPPRRECTALLPIDLRNSQPVRLIRVVAAHLRA